MSEQEKFHDYEKTARTEMEVLRKHFTWPKLTKLLHKHIELLDHELEQVKPLTYKKGWESIFVTFRGNRNPLWWKEMVLVIEEVKKEIWANANAKAESLYDSLRNRTAHIDHKIRYGYPLNQDTIIPRYFESSYKNRLANIEFIPLPDWNEGVEIFLGNHIDVAVLDFATALAYNSLSGKNSKLCFWPFFSFAGYTIVIKPAAIERFCRKHSLRNYSFKDLRPEHKKKFLEEQQYIVEQFTDFEWVLKKFCARNNCDPLLINENITYCNNNQAKEEFDKNTQLTVFCTNPVHVVDLNKSGDFELVHHNGDINHKNFNGLIFTEEYYQANRQIIRRLITNWFDDIKPFKTEIKTLAMDQRFRDRNYHPTYTVRNLITDLNEVTGSELQLNDLPFLYEHSNDFYEDPIVAFDDFYSKTLHDPQILQHYCAIALTRLGQPDENWASLQPVLKDIQNTMLALKK